MKERFNLSYLGGFLGRHLFFLLLLIFTLAGCGGSSSDSVILPSSSGPPPTAATGSVELRLSQVQSQSVSAQTAQRVRAVFTDHTNGEGALLFEATRDVAPSIVISGVPVTARSVRVTLLDGSGRSLATALLPVTVRADQTTVLTIPSFEDVVAEELVLDPGSAELRVGGERQFSARVRLSDGTTRTAANVAWSSTGTAALVDAEGWVKAVAPGSSSVTATAEGLSRTATVTVSPALPEPPGTRTLESFELDRTSLSVNVSVSLNLVATGTFSDLSRRVLSNLADGLTYDSSNSTVATVDDAGKLMALEPGTTTITATVGSLTQSLVVTVLAAPTGSDPVIDTGVTTYPVVPLSATPHLIAPEVTVTDSQTDLGGGELRIRGSHSYAVPTLAAPVSPVLGTITGDGTDKIIVALDSGVSPTMVAQFLRGVTAVSDGPQQDVAIGIELDNGHGKRAVGYTGLSYRSDQVLALTVNPGIPVSSTNFHDIQDAIVTVEMFGADGSTITLAPGDLRATGASEGNGEHYYYFAPSFSILGANAGIPVGTTASAPRGPESTLSSIVLYSASDRGNRVTIDGVRFVPNRWSSTDGPAGIAAMSSVYTAKNCIFDGEPNNTFGVNDLFGPTRMRSLIENCRMEGLAVGAVLYHRSSSVDVRGNIFRGNDQALFFEQLYTQHPSEEGFKLSDNLFENNVWHIEAYLLELTAMELTENAFVGTGKVANHGHFNLDLRNNWWGQATGPDPAKLINESTLGSILTTPFLTSNPLP